jgi:hypothetical protein
MARIFRDSGVLNQFGSPSLNSNTFANRPAFGQVGRLFISTDTLAIYRDTGTAWDNLTSGGGGSQNLEQVTTIGNNSTKGIFLGSTGSLTTGKLLEVKGSSLFTGNSGNLVYIGISSVSPNTSTLDVYGYSSIRNTVTSAANLSPILYSQYSINYAGTQLSGFANSLFAQDIYNVSASTSIASSTQSGTSLNVNTYKFSSVATITFTQPGGTIRAASALTAYSQFQNTAAGTITHAAGICILGIENLGGSNLNITNNYQLLINASDEFASTATITNPWGIYQAGANDKNYYAGSTSINNSLSITNFDDNLLPIIGGLKFFTNQGTQTCYIQAGKRAVAGYKLDIGGDPITFTNSNLGTEIARFTNNNLLIATTTNTGRRLVVSGEAEFIVTLGTSAYTTSGNYLSIWVNGVQYWLALLNPVLP